MKNIILTLLLTTLCVPIIVAQENRNQDSIYLIDRVDLVPEFIYGRDSLSHFINSQFEVPEMFGGKKMTSRAFFQFVVEPDSQISQIMVIGFKHPQFNLDNEKEGRRILKLTSGMWKPAILDGKLVRSKMHFSHELVYKPDTAFEQITPHPQGAVFRDVEKEAEFKYGFDSLMNFVQTQYNIPRIAQDSQITGKVFVQFVVDSDGTLSQLKALAPKEKQLGYGLEEECIRVLKLTSGKWNPAIRAGKSIRTYSRFTLVIKDPVKRVKE